MLFVVALPMFPSLFFSCRPLCAGGIKAAHTAFSNRRFESAFLKKKKDHGKQEDFNGKDKRLLKSSIVSRKDKGHEKKSDPSILLLVSLVVVFT